MTFSVPHGFLWGASTSGHQTEGNDYASDWWAIENSPAATFVDEPVGDADDSFHRWGEDMDLLAGAGFTDYRFSIEWSRIEPVKDRISKAAIAHYRAMVVGAVERGLRLLVTLHHFASPAWFSFAGGWLQPDGIDRFVHFVDIAQEILGDEVKRVCTINEPNMAAIYTNALGGAELDTSNGMPEADPALTARLIEAHHAARDMLHHNNPNVLVGWSVAMQACEPYGPDDLQAARDYAAARETAFVEGSRGDDWIGVQAYTRTRVRATPEGPRFVPVDDDAVRTLNGSEYYPAALGNTVREAARVLGDVPIIVTENGIATADDERRIAYTTEALNGLQEAMNDGIRIDGYFHWSLLDNYEWGSFTPTFGLIAVDRDTFRRTPKPSLGWLGGLRQATG